MNRPTVCFWEETERNFPRGSRLVKLVDYESGLRMPPYNVAGWMMTVLNSQLPAVQHLGNCTQFIRDITAAAIALALTPGDGT